MDRRRFLLALATPLALQGDKPQQSPHDFRVDSPNEKFFAFADAKKNRITISQRRAGQAVKLWEFPGWHPNVFIANDGHHFVVGYDGGGMLNPAYDKNQALVSFYNENNLIRKIMLSELIQDWSRLVTTASHVYWGRFIGFDNQDRYSVETVERRILFDVNGSPLRSE